MKNSRLIKIISIVKDICRLFNCLILPAGILISCSGLPGGKTDQAVNPNGRYDAWGYVGAGGGGAMFNPTVSPHDTDYAYVRCDMTGAYVNYNGGESWRMFNLRSPVRRFVFDRKNADVIYANSIALYRINDRGETWNRIKGYNFKWGKRVDPDPGDPEKIFIKTFGGGTWHSPAKGDPDALEDIVTPVAAY